MLPPDTAYYMSCGSRKRNKLPSPLARLTDNAPHICNYCIKYSYFFFKDVADNNLLIISAYSGWPGCTHDARVLRNSGLYRKAEAGEVIIQDHHLLADNAYPLRNWLISPCKNYGNLTPQQQRYNTKLSSARQSVERCFAHLKGRFRQLKEITLHDPSKITNLIMAGCILHNLCVIHTNDIEEFMDNNQVNDANDCQNIYQHGVHGVARRLRLVQGL